MSLRIGRRFSTINADEDLEIGNVYIMFPMNRVNSIVTPGDMGAPFITANFVMKQRVSGGKVKSLPELGVKFYITVEAETDNNSGDCAEVILIKDDTDTITERQNLCFIPLSQYFITDYVGGLFVLLPSLSISAVVLIRH
ncbi:hypothetical protein FEM48_Zijuj04G0181300 [Ziziphus jujuba var. spinosa]|uniref:Uncharacterized protein n=1 Tax=Ziziphus jujuba var. spinosa TaxID=714518 RepID=A0A978VLD8_ZIZJJ|nr:hypothetical protein FEM48_Zijuj04G0181300 [Ziziphus jujuba var. spinosa]